MIRAIAIALIGLACTWTHELASAQTRLGDACDLKDMALTDTSEFLRFDGALKQALAARDTAVLATLVDFPLRVNAGDGSVLNLTHAGALAAHFASVFTDKIRQTIAAQRPEQMWCNGDGQMMYGNGAVWVRSVKVGARRELRVAIVNADTTASSQRSSPRTPAFVCSTEHLHAVVDVDANGAARYRVWNTPHAASEKPDLELAGEAAIEGHGVCATKVWHFHSGNTHYIVSDPPGCGPDSETPHATIDVDVDGKHASTLRCH